MRRTLKKLGIGAGLFLLSLAFSGSANSADFVVYSVYKPLDLGNPGETPARDYYVNMGSQNGVREGVVLDVLRRVSTYDVQTEKLYRDITFKIGTLKVIHVEGNAAVARIDKLIPADKIPTLSQRNVMVGDLVRISGE